jgi:DNA polymerase III delta prime subunit
MESQNHPISSNLLLVVPLDVVLCRANPEAARRLGVGHVRGILLSGPPGCGKTLLARELSLMLGAREPQIVNGPEILDKFVGEAEKNIRALFAPAEIEYAQVGDASALHVIILDEMDAIARKRGSITGDSTGVRDSVVNQLLAKMDGVKEASNVLVVGLTNRPELLDPALLRPGRLEVQLRVELPDLPGRRDILRIHTRRMREAGGMSSKVCAFVEDLDEEGLPARTEHFTGAELAGLVRSAASFALARTVEEEDGDGGVVTIADLELALSEVRPALGKQDEVLEMRYPHGISPYSPSMERIMRDLERFTSTPEVSSTVKVKPQLQSMLVVGAGGNGGAGATALACWAAVDASNRGEADYVRLVTSLDLLSAGGGDEEARAAALVERFSEAGEMPNSLLVLDDVDQLCAGSGPGGYSSIMLATLRALLRSPPAGSNTAKAGGHSQTKKTKDGRKRGKTLRILAATSRSDAACVTLHELFDETLVVPLLSDANSVRKLLADGTEQSGLSVVDVNLMADMIVARLGSVACKTALRLTERAVAMAGRGNAEEDVGKAQITSLEHILDDLTSDEATMNRLCEVL